MGFHLISNKYYFRLSLGDENVIGIRAFNELKNHEIKDSSSTNYSFRRYPTKTRNFWWWFPTRSQCDVSEQAVRSPDFTFASKQRYGEDVLKSSLCQLCKIYVISASRPFQFAGILLSNVSLSWKLHSSWHTGSLSSVLCWASMHRLERERLRLVPVNISGAKLCTD